MTIFSYFLLFLLQYSLFIGTIIDFRLNNVKYNHTDAFFKNWLSASIWNLQTRGKNGCFWPFWVFFSYSNATRTQLISSTLSTLGNEQKDSGIYKFKLTIPEYAKTVLYYQRLKKPTNIVLYVCRLAYLFLTFSNIRWITVALQHFCHFLPIFCKESRSGLILGQRPQ